MVKKSIGISKRIPLDVIEAGLVALINDNYSNDYILEQLRIEISGENRIKKCLGYVNKIILRSPLTELLLDNKELLKQALRRKEDKQVIMIALLNTAYTFSFDILRIFGKYFSTQEMISREAVTKGISNIYSSNKYTMNALDSVVPMFLEAEFFSRPKNGLYLFEKPKIIVSDFANRIYQESFKYNQGVREFMDYQLTDSYFMFVSGEREHTIG